LVREQLVLTQPKGYIGCCAAIRNMDQRTCLKKIELPSLVVAAADDLATPSEYGKFITREIINCEYVELSDAAHLSNIEQRDAFNAALTKFLDRH
jgi:3-oxoadipate enol-lactonase